MTKTRKVIIAILTVCVLVCLSLFTITACGGGKKVESIRITSKAKTYVVGDEFDAASMVVTAYYEDDSEKELASKDYKYEIEEKYLDAAGKLKIDGTAESAKARVTVTYKDLEASQQFTITKPVQSLAKVEDPEKDTYNKGESFNPAGMTVKITYTDGTSTIKEVSADNGFEWELDGENVTITYGNKTLAYSITIENRVFIKAIDGLYDNRPVSEVDEGVDYNNQHTRIDASEAQAQEGAELLYRGHLNNPDYDKGYGALLQARFLKAWTYEPEEGEEVEEGEEATEPTEEEIEEAKQAALAAYIASDEYKNAEKDIDGAVADFKAGTNADKADWNYKKLVAKFRSSDEEGRYLGSIGVGATVSFVFNSSEETQGDITFRLASGYLLADDNWTPTEMGDIDFSKLCDMYVNGVKKDIAEGEVILEGGKTEDGSAVQQLWVLWAEVTFDDIGFVAGRNVIELVFKDCGLKNSHNQSFTCNIDSLIISPEADSTAEIDLYDNTKVGEDLIKHLTVTEITLAEETNITVKGTIEGYYQDVFSINLGNTKATVEFDGADFTATITLSAITYGEAALQVNGVDIKKGEELTLPENKIELDDELGTSYEIVEKDGLIYVVKGATGQVADLIDATIGTVTPKLEEGEDGKAYLVIGGEYTATILNYEFAEAKAIIEAAIKAITYFDLQENPYMAYNSWDGNWTVYSDLSFDIVAYEDGTYEIRVDISDLNAFCYTTHCDNTMHPSTSHDFKPDLDGFTQELEIGGKKYTLTLTPGGGDGEYWGCLGLKIENV